jgi:hypothetical protein
MIFFRAAFLIQLPVIIVPDAAHNGLFTVCYTSILLVW